MATISITQDEIDKGVEGNCRLCPVALAIRNVVDVYQWKPSVTAEKVIFHCQNYTKEIEIALPDEVGDFIQQFDEWSAWKDAEGDIQMEKEYRKTWGYEGYEVPYFDSVSPFSFELDLSALA